MDNKISEWTFAPPETGHMLSAVVFVAFDMEQWMAEGPIIQSHNNTPRGQISLTMHSLDSQVFIHVHSAKLLVLDGLKFSPKQSKSSAQITCTLWWTLFHIMMDACLCWLQPPPSPSVIVLQQPQEMSDPCSTLHGLQSEDDDLMPADDASSGISSISSSPCRERFYQTMRLDQEVNERLLSSSEDDDPDQEQRHYCSAIWRQRMKQRLKIRSNRRRRG